MTQEEKIVTAEQLEQIKAFWAWFGANQDEFFAFSPEDDKASTALFNKMTEQLAQIDADVSFEIGPVQDGTRELVISASGLRSIFPLVEAMLAAAPALSGWRVTAFRPRRDPIMTIEIDEMTIDPSEVLVQLYEDAGQKGKIGMIVYLEGYAEEVADAYHQVTYLLLDEALGEKDVEMKVSFIEFEPLGEEPPESGIPLTELAGVFDEFHAELNSPAN